MVQREQKDPLAHEDFRAFKESGDLKESKEKEALLVHKDSKVYKGFKESEDP